MRDSKLLIKDLHGLTANTESRPSNETPFVSGWKRMHTTVVINVQAPKRKYGPEDERSKKRGVVKAMIQLTICGYRTCKSEIMTRKKSHRKADLPS